MLRINLLPPYIYEGSARKKVVALWVVIVLAAVGGFFFWKTTLDKEAERIKQDTASITQRADDADRMQAQANDIKTASATIRGKADFVNKANEHDTQTYQRVVNNVATYTLRGVLYDALTPQSGGQQIVLPAFARDLATVGHYMIAMERNPEISNVAVQIGTIPGFPFQRGSAPEVARPPDVRGHNFVVTLTLVRPIAPGPTYPEGAAPAAGGGGGGGVSGMTAPMMSSGPMSGPPMTGGMGGPRGPMGAPTGPMSGGGMTAPPMSGAGAGMPTAPMSGGMGAPGAPMSGGMRGGVGPRGGGNID